MKSDYAVYTAYQNRVLPVQAISSRLVACGGVRGERVARAAECSVFAPRTVQRSIVGTLADHGIAIGYVERETLPDGSAIRMRLKEWPLEHVHYERHRQCLRTNTRNGPPEDIVHANGRWIVFKGADEEPWAEDAALVPLGLVWAGHAYGQADWAGSSKSHGQVKAIGKLAAGYAMVDAAGKLTPEANGLLSMLQSLISGDAGAGVVPFGADVELLNDNSTMWQVFAELLIALDKAAMRIYLGTDAPLGSTGGAPGVDIEKLFRIAAAKIAGDFQVLADGLNTGLYQPWAACNYGDTSYAPRLEYDLPDPDAEQESEAAASRYERFTTAIKLLKDGGFTVDQRMADRVAADVGLSPAPLLVAGTPTAPIPLAPTDVAKIVTVNEARVRAANVEALPATDPRGAMFLSELDAPGAPGPVPGGAPPAPTP